MCTQHRRTYRTRCGRRGTAPDVTVCHASWVGSVGWRVGEDLASDHRPLHIMIEIQQRKPSPGRRRAGPCLRIANWTLCRSLTDRKLKIKLRHLASAEVATKRFTRILVKAAGEAVTRAPPRKNATVCGIRRSCEAEEGDKGVADQKPRKRRNHGSIYLENRPSKQSHQGGETESVGARVRKDGRWHGQHPTICHH